MKDEKKTPGAKAKNTVNNGLNQRDVLIYSSVPGMRILSAFFMVFGLLVGVLPQFARNRDEVGVATLAGLFLVGVVLFGAAAFFGNLLKRRDIFFSVTNQTLTVREKTWLTQRSTYTTYPIVDIVRFDIASERDSDGDNMYSLTMALKNGRKIPLSDRVGVRSYIEERKAILDEAVFGGGTKLSSLLTKQQEEKRIPKPVIATVLIVCIIPVVALTAGNMMHSGKNASGVTPVVSLTPSSVSPDGSTVSPDGSTVPPSRSSAVSDKSGSVVLEQIARSSLKQGEDLIWYGQPEFGRESSTKMPFFLPFAIVWTLFSLAFTGIAWSAARQGQGPAGYAMALFGVPFVLIGFGLLVLPFFASETEAKTIFVITDQRAFSYANGKPYREISYRDRDFGPVEVTYYKAGRGDVLFIKDADEGHSHPYTGFYGVENPTVVAALLEKQAAIAAARSSSK